MRNRWDETWHRLRGWTNGQAQSERLAAQILIDAGFEALDPSHPLGGRDGGKDALCTRNGEKWAMAVYFPRDQKDFTDILKKFSDDLAGANKNDVTGMAFVTNQELRLAEREHLNEVAGALKLDLFHLERVTTALDKPSMAGVRSQFLSIDDLSTAAPSVKSGDQSLFGTLLTDLPSGGRSLRFLKEQDIGAPFRSDDLTELNQFAETWNDAAHEFQDSALEAQRKKLLLALVSFLRELSTNIFPSSPTGFLTMDLKDFEDRPEKLAVRDKLHELANNAYKEHQTLVRIGRTRFP